MYFAENREAKGLEAKDVAELSGLHKSTISRMESGERPAKADQIIRYAEAIKVRPGALFYPPGEAPVEDMLGELSEDLRQQLAAIIAELPKGSK